MNKSIGILALMVVSVLISVLAREGIRTFTRREVDVTSQGHLSKIASEINKVTPMMIDSETEGMNVSAADETLIYNYRLVHLKAANVSPTLLEETLRPGATGVACSSPETRSSLLEKGVTLRYVYHDQDRAYITEFEVSLKDCESS